MKYKTVEYSRVKYSTVQYNTVEYSEVQYSTVQYSALKHITFPPAGPLFLPDVPGGSDQVLHLQHQGLQALLHGPDQPLSVS